MNLINPYPLLFSLTRQMAIIAKGGPARHASPQGEAGGEEFPLYERGQGGFFQGIIVKPSLQNTSPYLRIWVLS